MSRTIYIITFFLLFASCSYKPGSELLNYPKALTKAEKMAIKQSIKVLDGKVELFYLEKSKYPTTFEELKPYRGGSSLTAPRGVYKYNVEEHKFSYEKAEQ